MIAAVIRHAKVDIEWDFWQTSKEYDQGCADYDTAPVLPVEVHLPDADFKRQGIDCDSVDQRSAGEVRI